MKHVYLTWSARFPEKILELLTEAEADELVRFGFSVELVSE